MRHLDVATGLSPSAETAEVRTALARQGISVADDVLTLAVERRKAPVERDGPRTRVHPLRQALIKAGVIPEANDRPQPTVDLSGLPYAPAGDAEAKRYADVALASECATMARTPEGGRNHQLNVSAYKLGTLVAAGHLDREVMVKTLWSAAKQSGLDDREIARTIRSGATAGAQKPRQVRLRGNGNRVDQKSTMDTGPDTPTILRATALAGMKPKATKWLWSEPGAHEFAPDVKWLPQGGLTLLAGREGIGKSTWGYRLAAKITRGTLPGTDYGAPKSVIIVAGEDSYEHTILPRLLAAGADTGRVYRIDAVIGDYSTTVTLPRDVNELRALCARHDIALVLLDPLMSTMDGRFDSHKDADIRRALDPLARFANESLVTVIGLIHENKSRAGNVLDRLMASKAFAAVARCVLMCATEIPEPGVDTGRETFLFGQPKNNLGPKVPHTLRYHITGETVGHDDDTGEPVVTSRVVVEGRIEGRIEELIAAQENRTPGKETRTGEAAKWLREFLDGKTHTPRADVFREGMAADFTERTLERAGKSLGVIIKPIPGTNKQTTWELPGGTGGTGASGATGGTGVTDSNEGSPASSAAARDGSELGGTPVKETQATVAPVPPDRRCDQCGGAPLETKMDSRGKRFCFACAPRLWPDAA